MPKKQQKTRTTLDGKWVRSRSGLSKPEVTVLGVRLHDQKTTNPATDEPYPSSRKIAGRAFVAGFGGTVDFYSNGQRARHIVHNDANKKTGLDRVVNNARRSAIRVLNAQRYGPEAGNE